MNFISSEDAEEERAMCSKRDSFKILHLIMMQICHFAQNIKVI